MDTLKHGFDKLSWKKDWLWIGWFPRIFRILNIWGVNYPWWIIGEHAKVIADSVILVNSDSLKDRLSFMFTWCDGFSLRVEVQGFKSLLAVESASGTEYGLSGINWTATMNAILNENHFYPLISQAMQTVSDLLSTFDRKHLN